MTGADMQFSPAQFDYDYLLIDTVGEVRQMYKGINEEILTTIVEDIALILPHRKSKDIKMKNQKNK